MSLIGQPITRVDGPAKVTGTAHYAADFPLERMAYAAVVQSTIARGSITGFDLSEAEALPGVLKILTYQNAPRLGEIPEISPVDPEARPTIPSSTRMCSIRTSISAWWSPRRWSRRAGPHRGCGFPMRRSRRCST